MNKEAELMLKDVADVFGVKTKDILGESRFKMPKTARFTVAFILRNWGWSLKDIGKFLNRDHTTIINSLDKIEMLLGNSRKPYVDAIRGVVDKYSGVGIS